MIVSLLALFLFANVAAPARAQDAQADAGPALEADHEAFYLLGWNKACSVGLAHYAFPKVGEAIADEPIYTRIGTLTIEPGQENAVEKWAFAAEGKNTWNPRRAADAKSDLAKAGYNLAGYKELIRPEAVVEARDLPRLILSTDTFRSKSTAVYPDPSQYRLAFVYYAPFASCALLVYRELGQRKDFYKEMLIRVETPRIRHDRALSHIDNGLLLLQQGDRVGAVAETAIAAKMAPEYAEARYKHAALLNLDGQTEAAVDELQNALKLDPTLRDKAREDPDFDSLKGFPRFDDLVNVKKP